MLDVGPSTGEVDSLLVFVDRLGAAGTDRAAARAHEQVRGALDEDSSPPGLRRLAEGLSAAAGDLPPPPRRPSDDPGSVVAAIRDNALLVLDDVDPGEVAAAVAALVDDGRRVIVTAAEDAALEAVRATLPAATSGRVVDTPPALSPADLCRLRVLLATSSPARRSRPAQQLPELADLPDVAEVAELCAVAVRPPAPETELIAPVLAALDTERREAVASVARCVQRSLSTLGAHSEPWVWELLTDLVHGRHRPAFDALMQSTAQALATIEDGRDDPPVRVTGPLPDGAVDTLVAYLQYRESGGRTRGPFRSALQRDVEPLLRVLRVGDREPETSKDLRMVLTHFELGERLVTVDADCAELDLPTPQNPAELAALSAALVDIGAAARSVGALRHDMLFLGSTSPVAVPDVAAAEHLALAVLDYEENGSAAEAGERLDALAAATAALVPAHLTAPEHARAVAALCERDAAAYVAAVDDLAGAHRERYDEQRTAALLEGLGSPTLAEAWTGTRPGSDASPADTGADADGPVRSPALVPVDADGAPPARCGFVRFTLAADLLEELPAPDSADVVVVLDAGRLGIDRALLAVAAPRLIAAAGPGSRSGSATLLGLLHRAGALVIRGRAPETTGRVVPIVPAARSMPVTGRGGVEQAGA